MHMSLIDGAGRAGRFHAPRWAALLVVLGLMACKTQPPEEHAPSGPSLYLELASLKGETVSKALVRLSSGEEQRSTEQGSVLLDNLPVGRQALLVQADGFSSTVLAFDVGQDVRAGARLKLLPLGEPRTFDAGEGLKDLEVGGVQLTVPAGSLRDAQGHPIQGEVEVFLSALDLDKGELLAAPGLLEGVPVPGAEPVGLESLGIVSLVFRQDGRVIPFARGTHIGGNVPGRPGSAGTPDGRPGTRRGALSSTPTHPPVPIWRMDAESGRWVPTADEAVVTGSRWEVTLNNTPSLFNVALPFWWRTPEASPGNPLKPPTPSWVGTACLEVKVEDENGEPVAGRMVVAQGVDYTGLTREMTDASGRVRLEVMRSRLVDVDAGGEATRVSTGGDAGTCSGQGAPPVPVTLTVAAPLCAPGIARDCAYSGPTQGSCRAATQSCDAQGSAWSACEGEIGPQKERCDTPEDDDCDGTVNESCKRLCQEGETQPCYRGPEGTEDVGVCRGGTRTCVAGGTAWSACEGQVLPTAEDYTRPEDEDCSGMAGLCLPGVSRRCAYTGPVGTEDVGLCHAGTQTCNDSGTAWSACTGEVLPLAEEDCTTAGDDDCDGQTNEVSVCICVPGTSDDCYEGPEGTEDVGVCRGGTKTCGADGKVWSACAGQVVPAAEDYSRPEDEDCDGLAGLCTPGASRQCAYTGPAGTEDVGECHAGTQTCNGTGTAWNACSGEVLPTAENYTQPEDEDCNGRAEVCPSGSSRGCPYTGPAGTENVGICHAGTQTCNGTGTAWNACTGEVTPQAESCASALDEDCDGHVNEAPPCGWVVTTGMTSARAHHASVKLNDGKVLVMGGVGVSNEALDTAAVYDPAAKTWTAVGPMSVKRKNFAAVLLKDGKVLVMGGKDDSGALASAEVYDPVNQDWTTVTSVGSLATARESHTATLLTNGQVLVTGGYGSSGLPLASAEVYDPANKNWTAVPSSSMGTPRALHTATLLDNGKVLVIGGKRDATTSLASAEVYDPADRSWTPARYDMTGGARFVHTATRLGNGHVLVAGGFRNGANVLTTEVYDPATEEWTSAGSLNTPRDEHTAVLLSTTGHVLISGGDNSVTATATAEMYDPAARKWTVVAPMTAARAAHTMVVLGTGEVLVIGGRSGSSSGSLVTTEVYNPAAPTTAGAWMSTRSMSVPRHSHTATLLPNGKVLIAGGNDSTILKSAEVYDPASGEWTPTGNMKSAREAHTATLLPNGKVLVVGGRNGTATALETAELYDPFAGTWSDANDPMSPKRVQHTATLLSTGKVLIAGGHDGTDALKTARLYDPDTGTWSDARDLNLKRRWHTATLLPDGKVLVTGGQDGSHSIGTAELYDPGPDTWTMAPALSLTRDWHTAVWLGNGKVLVSGGHDDNGGRFRGQSELYTPGATAWTNTLGTLFQARREHTATRLDDGKVLVVGGMGNPGSGGDIYLPSAELYDPDAGTWSSANFLAAPVARHTATLLGNGMVLITGGHNANSPLSSALLYNP